MRVVLDTNILISALITKGTPPDLLYQAFLRGEHELITSMEQIAETAEVLARPKLQRILNTDQSAAIIENLNTRATVMPALPPVTISPDPKDNHIIAAAIAGNADMIVSGDKKDVLSLWDAIGIPIVTARHAVERINKPRSFKP